VARGFDPVASNLPSVLRQLKPKCGGGGTTRDDTVEVQGEHVDSVVALLNELGYPAREG
jgi:translation initiation factor 1